MAFLVGEDSRWLRQKVRQRALALAAYGVILVTSVILMSASDRVGASVVIVLFGAKPAGWLARRYRNARKGAAAEQDTLRALAELPSLFTVINDVEFNGFNVDHVVVGPTGVWAIETKASTGEVEETGAGVCRNGRVMFRDPRRQARGGAMAIAERLLRDTDRRYWVEALVCVPHATVRTWNNTGSVLEPRSIVERIVRAPQRLSLIECGQIRQALLSGRSPSRSKYAA